MTDATPAIDSWRTALLVMDHQNAIIGRLRDAAPCSRGWPTPSPRSAVTAGAALLIASAPGRR